MGRWIISSLLIALPFSATPSNRGCSLSQSKQVEGDDVEVRLSLTKSVFAVGQPVQVTVEIQNSGSEPLLFQNSLLTGKGFSSSIEFSVSDSDGNRSPSGVMFADFFSIPEKPDPLIAIVSGWLLLRPHYSLMHQFNLDSGEFSFLARPGRYRIWANYSSAGLGDPLTYSRLGLSSKDVESLKYKSWTGKVRSNDVWIVVTDRRK